MPSGFSIGRASLNQGMCEGATRPPNKRSDECDTNVTKQGMLSTNWVSSS